MFDTLLEGVRNSGMGGKIQKAIVVDNNDPNKNQRVKYRIATLHTEYTDDELLWAKPFGWSVQGNSSGVGSVNIPQVGSNIAVFYPDDDDHIAYYIADLHDDTTQVEDFLEDYPHSYGFCDRSGNLLLINTETNVVKFVHFTGSYVKILADGSMEIASQAGIKMHGKGIVSIRSDIAINIDAPMVNMENGLAAFLTMLARTRPAEGNFDNQRDY